MATIVNNPPAQQPANNTGNGNGFLVGVILLILAAIAFFYYGLPYVSNSMGGGAQVTVPEQIDVNVNQQPK